MCALWPAPALWVTVMTGSQARPGRGQPRNAPPLPEHWPGNQRPGVWPRPRHHLALIDFPWTKKQTGLPSDPRHQARSSDDHRLCVPLWSINRPSVTALTRDVMSDEIFLEHRRVTSTCVHAVNPHPWSLHSGISQKLHLSSNLRISLEIIK